MQALITETIAKLIRPLAGRVIFRKPLPDEFGGASLFVTSRSDMRLLFPGYERAAYDLLMVSHRYVRPGFCVWDIGSNVGIFTFCSAFKAGKSGRTYSVEADPKYAELQNRSNATLPAQYSPVTVLCAAVADREGILELDVPKNGHARNHLSVVAGNGADQPESRKSVVSVSIDFLCSHWARPDFVKIDIEGAELLALYGANKLLSEIRPIIYIEVSEQTRGAVTALLRKFNYQLFRLDDAGEEIAIEQCAFNTIAKPCPATVA